MAGNERTGEPRRIDDCAQRVYQNEGNPELLSLLDLRPGGAALDCGCGAGDNARMLLKRGWKVTGVTISPDEQAEASKYCGSVFLYNLEHGAPPEATGPYDLILMSHVLEHLRNPTALLGDAKKLLAPGGKIAVALPNILFWKCRLEFLLGRFDYSDTGIMDNTHVRFYTFQSAIQMLSAQGFKVDVASASGSFPLRPIRRIFPAGAEFLDRLSSRLWPGLFGWQLFYIASVPDE